MAPSRMSCFPHMEDHDVKWIIYLQNWLTKLPKRSVCASPQSAAGLAGKFLLLSCGAAQVLFLRGTKLLSKAFPLQLVTPNAVKTTPTTSVVIALCSDQA